MAGVSEALRKELQDLHEPSASSPIVPSIVGHEAAGIIASSACFAVMMREVIDAHGVAAPPAALINVAVSLTRNL